MPIYEFYCVDCHTLFSFLARKPNTSKRPNCPRCDRPQLERRASAFAISRGVAAPADEGDAPEGFDEARMERVMAEMAGEVDRIDENDPRQMAGMMRRMFDGAGLAIGPGMEEAIRRMEAGDDPDRIEQEMGPELEGPEGDWFGAAVRSEGLKSLRRRFRPADVDPELYEL